MITQVGNNRLFIGNADDAMSNLHLQTYNINAVVNTALDLDTPFFDHIRHYKIGLLDGPGNKFYDYWISAILVMSLLEDSKTVLVHCHEGKSRSVAIVLIVVSLMEFRDISIKESIKESFKYIQASRPDIFVKKSHYPFIAEVIKSMKSLPDFQIEEELE
jgi:protein-tyrosine phosphatase